MEDQKPWTGLTRKQDFAKSARNVKKWNCLIERHGEQTKVTQTYRRRGSGDRQPLRDFFVFFGKKKLF